MIQQKMPIFIPLHKYINVFAKDIISVLHCILKVGSYGIMMFPTTICFVIFLSFIQKLHQRILHFPEVLFHIELDSADIFLPLSLSDEFTFCIFSFIREEMHEKNGHFHDCANGNIE